MDPSTALALAAALALVYVTSESTALHFSRTGRRAFLAAVSGALGYAVAGALPRLDAWWLVVSAVRGERGKLERCCFCTATSTRRLATACEATRREVWLCLDHCVAG